MYISIFCLVIDINDPLADRSKSSHSAVETDATKQVW